MTKKKRLLIHVFWVFGINNTVSGFSYCLFHRYCYVFVGQHVEWLCSLKHFQLVQLTTFSHEPHLIWAFGHVFGKSACNSRKELLFSNFQESRINWIWYCPILLDTFQITHCVCRQYSDVPSGFWYQICTERNCNDTKCFSSNSCFESVCSCWSNSIWWLLWRVAPSPPHKFWTVIYYWAIPYKTVIIQLTCIYFISIRTGLQACCHTVHPDTLPALEKDYLNSCKYM